jgi:hypothetical protein
MMTKAQSSPIADSCSSHDAGMTLNANWLQLPVPGHVAGILSPVLQSSLMEALQIQVSDPIGGSHNV